MRHHALVIAGLLVASQSRFSQATPPLPDYNATPVSALRDAASPLDIDTPALLAAQPYVTTVNNGPASNRVDIVFVGDGYRQTDIDSGLYATHANAMVNHLFHNSLDAPFFSRYENFFNVHMVNVVSNEAGADEPPNGVFKDTALDASYWWDGVTERLLYFSSFKANTAVANALAGTGISADMRVGTVNASRYGGGGGTWGVYAGANGSAPEVALHEVGHSFAGLADEYFYTTPPYNTPYSGGEPGEPNITKSAATDKWDRWLGYDDPLYDGTGADPGTIGYYEGGRYYQYGLYRPSNGSKMRYLNRPFDAISREAFIDAIYDDVNPLDDFLSNAVPLFNPSSLWVQTVDPAVIAVEWLVDSVAVAVGEALDFGALGLAPGDYLVTAHAYDAILDQSNTGGALDWWRLADTSPLNQTVTWEVTIALPAGDANFDGTVNALDLSIVGSNWLATVGGGSSDGDFNADGTVNAQDLSILATNWLVGTSGAGVAFDDAVASVSLGSTPEPSSVLLLGAGCGLLMRRRR